MPDPVRVEITTVDKTGQGIKSASDNILGMSSKTEAALSRIAVGAGIATAAILAVADRTINKFGDLDRSLKALDATERAYVGTTGLLRQEAKDLEDRFFSLQSVGQGLQNLIAGGLGMKEAGELIEGFKARAQLLGNAQIPLEQRLVNLTQAFKTESSELGDASGMTENFSKLVERGAQLLGKKVDQLTASERAMAKYKAIMEITTGLMGQTADMTQGLSADQAAYTNELNKAEQTIGKALAPAYQVLLQAITGVTSATRIHAEQNAEAVRGATVLTVGITAGIAAVSGLAVAFRGLTAAMATNPIGLVIAGVGALGGALAGLLLNEKAAQLQTKQNNQELYTLTQRYQQLQEAMAGSTLTTDQRKMAEQELQGLIQRIGEMMPEVVSKWDAEGKAVEISTEKLHKYNLELRDTLKLEAQKQISDAEKAENTARDALNTFLGKTGSEKKHYLADIQFAIGQTNLKGDEAARVMAEAEAGFNKGYAEAEAKLRQNLARAEASTSRYRSILAGYDAPVVYGPPYPAGGGDDGGGGGGGTPPDPYQQALKYVEYLKGVGRLTTQEEIAMLEEIQRTTASTSEARMDIEQRIYAAKAALSEKEKQDTEATRKAKLDAAQSLLDHQLRMNEASAKEEIIRVREILDTYELTAEERNRLEERLADAQSRYAAQVAGDLKAEQDLAEQTAETRVRGTIDRINHEQRMGQLSRDQEIAALQTHLTEEADYYRVHTDELWTIEERIQGLKDAAREEDLQKEKQAVTARKEIQQDVLKELDKAEKDALEAFKARAKVKEDALQARIDAREEELRLLERQFAAEDRLTKIEEARQRITDLQRTGERETVILADGRKVVRIRGMDEAEKALADAERDDERAQQREALQDQVANLRNRLDNLKESHADQATEIQRHFTDAKEILQTGFSEMDDAQAEAIQGMAENLSDRLTVLLSPWQTYVSQVQSLLNSIGTPTPPGGSSTSTQATVGETMEQIAQAIMGGMSPAAAAAKFGFTGNIGGKWYENGLPAHGEGGRFTVPHLAMVGDRPETTVPDQYLPRLALDIARFIPTMPVLGTMGGATIQNLNLHLPNVTDAQGFARELPGALQQAMIHIPLGAVQRGMARGNMSK